jgi:CRP-like cAMP-binding protein
LREVIKAYPGISNALSREMVRESNIAFEWIVNLGNRTALERIAHLFCEMAVKTGAAQERDTVFTFPITQTMLADATGLSVVHANRSLQALRKEKVLRFERGYVQIPSWRALVDVAGFRGAYLESERSLQFANHDWSTT